MIGECAASLYTAIDSAGGGKLEYSIPCLIHSFESRGVSSPRAHDPLSIAVIIFLIYIKLFLSVEFWMALRKRVSMRTLRHCSALPPRQLSAGAECNVQCSLEVRNNIPNILDPHQHSNRIRRNSTRDLFLLSKLRMRRRRGMNYQRLHITHIRQVTRQLSESTNLLAISHHSKREHAPHALDRV